MVATIVVVALVTSRGDKRRAPPGQRAPAPPARESLGARVRAIFGGGQAGPETWTALEEALVRADVGPRAAADLVTRVRASFRPPADPAAVLAAE
ncbi:MAG: hypothetical protein E6J75_19470, partial [Deltaproteobacteria bacterium]